MDGWISSLSGLFDGYTYHEGPISVRIEGQEIVEIVNQKVDKSVIDGHGKILSTPFVDGHTHLIFAGNRFEELGLKLSGASYNDILAQGGGIQSTVRATREASREELRNLVRNRLNIMKSFGTLSVEAKSGYGLNTEHELLLLEILNDINLTHDVEIHPTFGAAHVVPEEVSRDDYISEIIDVMLPQVKKQSLATSTDVFCDKGAFTVEETLQIFEASEKIGLPVRVHAEELEYSGIAQQAAESYSLLSADHLLNATKEDFEVLSEQGTTAMFMPVAPLGLFVNTFPTGFASTDVTIGLGSDFNPNNWVLSMQTAIRMAVYQYRMSPVDAFIAATSGSYYGITGSKLSRLETNSSATFILLNATSLSEVVSKFGQNLVSHVFKNGDLLHENHHSFH